VRVATKTQWIEYKQGSTPLSGHLVYDDAVAGKSTGVLMIHDRSGFMVGYPAIGPRQRERDWQVVVLRGQTDAVFLAVVSPLVDFDTLHPAFEKMPLSVRF
jgi:hypothetical protein